MNIKFSESLTETFEYPSFESSIKALIEEQTIALKTNSAVGGKMGKFLKIPFKYAILQPYGDNSHDIRRVN